MERRGTTERLKYDAENRLVKVSSDSDGKLYIARMAYDGDGRRVKRVDNYGTIPYVGSHYERNRLGQYNAFGSDRSCSGSGSAEYRLTGTRTTRCWDTPTCGRD